MNLRTRALDLLFPSKCPFCRQILQEPRAPLCSGCQPKLPWLEGKRAECKVDFADTCISPLSYRGTVPEAVRRFKFGGGRACASAFAVLVAQCVRDHSPVEADLITWAPVSKQRLRERGYDQAELLARRMGEHLELPVMPLLNKHRHTGPQSELKSDSARRANALGAYALLPESRVEGKRILLVDDIVTSGATLSECCRILKQAGAAYVCCVTLANAGNREKSEKNG